MDNLNQVRNASSFNISNLFNLGSDPAPLNTVEHRENMMDPPDLFNKMKKDNPDVFNDDEIKKNPDLFNKFEALLKKIENNTGLFNQINHLFLTSTEFIPPNKGAIHQMELSIAEKVIVSTLVHKKVSLRNEKKENQGKSPFDQAISELHCLHSKEYDHDHNHVLQVFGWALAFALSRAFLIVLVKRIVPLSLLIEVIRSLICRISNDLESQKECDNDDWSLEWDEDSDVNEIIIAENFEVF